MHKFLIYVLLYSLFYSVPSAVAQADTAGQSVLMGNVMVDNIAQPFASVGVYSRNKLIKRVTADAKGKFEVIGLQEGWYRLNAITTDSSVLISRNVYVGDANSEIAYCEDFFLTDRKPRVGNKEVLAGNLTDDIDSICVIKHTRMMYVYKNKKLLKSYHVSLGFSPIGHKQFQGDGKTPEGKYFINDKNQFSKFHKSLGISYPNKQDMARAKQLGKQAGGDIKIHGIPNTDKGHDIDYISSDWTWGCIAVVDKEVDELFVHTAIGTVINILP